MNSETYDPNNDPNIKMTIEEFNNHLKLIVSKRTPEEHWNSMSKEEQIDYQIWSTHRLCDVFKKEDLIKDIGKAFILLMVLKQELTDKGAAFLRLMEAYKTEQNFKSRFMI